MSNKRMIMYCIVTVWLCVGMLASGVQQIFLAEGFVEIVAKLGYPRYLLIILGVWKLLGAVAVLVPGFTLVKEWAYAGFFFFCSGAAASHLFAGEATESLGAIFLLVLTVLSWYLRPANRRIQSAT